jgi:hypothetical protein
MPTKDINFTINQIKGSNKVLINLTLLGICFTIFTFIATINPVLLKNDLLAIQLVLSIPFFMSAILIQSKISCLTDASRWRNMGFLTFIIAYGFLINAVGLMLSFFTSSLLVSVFFIVNIFLSIMYSEIEISADKDLFREKLYRDSVFIAIMILGGLLPALGVY